MANRKKPKGTKNARVAAKRAERLRNTGPDASGNFGVNPWSARGHVVEVAPKELRDNPNSQQFPKRIATQRMIDRYFAHGHISQAEHRAADAMWQAWVDSGLEARVCAGYDPDVVQGGRASTDGMVAARVDGANAMTGILQALPYRCRGVVRAVVIEDRSAADWARQRGYGRRDSERRGIVRLRSGLQALSQHLWG